MVLEVAMIKVLAGHEDAFADAYRAARVELISTPGLRSARMTRGVESPATFILLAEWDSVEAHERNFRGTERFTRWRAALGPHFAEPPVVEHFTDVPAGTPNPDSAPSPAGAPYPDAATDSAAAPDRAGTPNPAGADVGG